MPVPSLPRPSVRGSAGKAWNRHSSSTKRSEEHTSELQSPDHLVCRLLLEKKKKRMNASHKNIVYAVFILKKKRIGFSRCTVPISYPDPAADIMRSHAALSSHNTPRVRSNC